MSQWYLRKDETIYGPKSLAELTAWAADGRIAPDDFLSEDQQNWRAAPTIPELGLQYTIQLEDQSTYGPVHLLVLSDLLQEGDLLPTTPVQHVGSGETRTVTAWLIPYLVSRHATAVNEVAELKTLLDSSERRRESAENAAQQLTGSETVDVRDIPKEVLKWQRLYETEREHRMESEDQAAKQIKELKVDLQNAYSEKDRLAYRASTAEKKIKRFQDTDGTVTHAATNGAGGDPAVEEAYHRLMENYDDLLRQLEEKSQELTQLRSARPAQSASADVRIKELEAQLELEKSTRDNALERLSELEQSHMKLLKSFREMNDQFIRSRNQNR